MGSLSKFEELIKSMACGISFRINGMLLIHSSLESTGIEHCEYSIANQYAVPITAIRNVYNNQFSMLK